MKTNNPILVAVLMAAFTLSGAYAKSYDVQIERPMMAGAVQIPAGPYKLEVQDATAVLTNTKTKKDFTIPVKVTNTDQKFQYTLVETDRNSNPEQITSIRLGGAKVRLDVVK